MTPLKFRESIAQLTAELAGRPLDVSLDAWLNEHHGAGSTTYRQLRQACEAGVAEHRPTVSNGRAFVLYLLPQGSIEFTR